MCKLPRFRVHQSQSLLRLIMIMRHRFATRAVLTLLASLPSFANAAQYGNDPLGQAYTHDGGGYVYDANQNQTFQYVKAPGSTTPTVAYAEFPGLEIEYRLDERGNLTRRALRRYVSSQRKTVIGPSDDAIVESDALGNTTMVRHNVSTAYANYTPFGQMIASRTNGFSNEWYAYKGGRIDLTGTGFYRFGARDYDPRTGGWNSRDPIRYRPSMAYANPYAAFDENPIANDDPSGLQSMPGNAVEHPTPVPPPDNRGFCQASPGECINGEPNSRERARYYRENGRLPGFTPLAVQQGTLQPGGTQPGSRLVRPASIEDIGTTGPLPWIGGGILAGEALAAGAARLGLQYAAAARAAAIRQFTTVLAQVGAAFAGGSARPVSHANTTGNGGQFPVTSRVRAGVGGFGAAGGGSRNGPFVEFGSGVNPRAPAIARNNPNALVFAIERNPQHFEDGQWLAQMEQPLPANYRGGVGHSSAWPANSVSRVYAFFPEGRNAQGMLRDGYRALLPGGNLFLLADNTVSRESITAAARLTGGQYGIMNQLAAQAFIPEYSGTDSPGSYPFNFGLWLIKPHQ